MKKGALPGQSILELIRQGAITGAKEDSVRPGSLDLSLTDEVYRVSGVFLPGCDETVEEAIKRAGGTRMAGEKKILEKNCCYAVCLEEQIVALPRDVYAYANPKSSSGRVDIHVRLLVDKTSRYDAIDKGYCGKLWALIVPKTFPVIISPGLSLNQLRLFNQDTRLEEMDLEMSFSSNGGLLFELSGNPIRYNDLKHSDRDGSILLSLGLGFDSPGFEAIPGGQPIDLLLRSHYDPRVFFREVGTRENSLTLRSDVFYILSTRESVRVPENMACEMRPMDERSGDLRSHYAGFIDPGWGVGSDNTGKGRPLTLEVRSFDTGIIITDGQPIAKIRYERMSEVPMSHYDQMSPTYGSQSGPQLGKQFAKWK